MRCMAYLSTQSGESLSPAVRACLQGGGGPQIGEVTCGGSPHLSCTRDQMTDRAKFLGSNVLKCCLKITTVDLRKSGFKMRE